MDPEEKEPDVRITLWQRLFHGPGKTVVEKVDSTGIEHGVQVDRSDTTYGGCEYCGRGFLPTDRTFRDSRDGSLICWECAVRCWGCRRFVSPLNSHSFLGGLCVQCTPFVLARVALVGGVLGIFGIALGLVVILT